MNFTTRGAMRGLMVALLQVAIVGTLGVKLLHDRERLPRVWVQAAPYDPSMPLRGRYVSLQIVVEPHGVPEPPTEKKPALWQPLSAVKLRAEEGKLVAEAVHPATAQTPGGAPSQAPAPTERYDASDLHVLFAERGGQKLALLDRRVPYFIPEHIPDPSLRPAGEQLWVEVTIPEKGPPRPIRLGVKKGDGPVLPLEL